MEVLNEYIADVPITNLWHLWAVFVFLLLIGIVLMSHRQEGIALIFIIESIALMVMVATPITANPHQHIERQGYISDPAAFVEMFDEWKLVDQQDSLFTMRKQDRMTKDEIKEWKKHD